MAQGFFLKLFSKSREGGLGAKRAVAQSVRVAGQPLWGAVQPMARGPLGSSSLFCFSSRISFPMWLCSNMCQAIYMHSRSSHFTTDLKFRISCNPRSYPQPRIMAHWPRWQIVHSELNFSSFATYISDYATEEEVRDLLELYVVNHRPFITPGFTHVPMCVTFQGVHFELKDRLCTEQFCERCTAGRSGWQFRWVDARWTPQCALNLKLSKQEAWEQSGEEWPVGILKERVAKSLAPTDEEGVWCDVCEFWLPNKEHWEIHKKTKNHRKMVKLHENWVRSSVGVAASAESPEQ